MLGSFRRFAATWPAKIFFILLVASFGLWGVADVVRNFFSDGGDPNSVASVGGQRIDPAELQRAARRVLAQHMQQERVTTPPTPEMRRFSAEEALQQLVVQASLASEAKRLNLQVPDDALRQVIFQDPAFQGVGGQFDHNAFLNIMRSINDTEAHYLALTRTKLGNVQVIDAVRAGGYAPDIATKLIFGYEGETRTADLVNLPFAGAVEPPAPTPDQIERQYDDNAEDYRTPEFRRVRVLILSPDSVSRDIDVSDADAKAYFDSHKSSFVKVETRTAQVIVAPTEAAGKALATAWIAGADWTDMQAKAAAANASAVQLDDSTKDAFPSPALADPVFAAGANAVTGPVQAEGGWPVFKVIKLQAGGEETYDSVAAQVKAKVALDKAGEEIDDRTNQLQDLLAANTDWDKLPAGLGVAALAGTLDAKGTTPDGTPAPLPDNPALRQAIITRAFALSPGDAPTLDSGPDNTSFTIRVEAIQAPELPPLEKVTDRVKEDWLRAARRHEQEVIATQLLTTVNGGGKLADAAATAKVAITHSPPIRRPAFQPGARPDPFFTTDLGHATMAETTTGFIVAVPTSINKPDPVKDVAGLNAVAKAGGVSMSNDLEATFLAALRDRDRVTINRPLFESMVQ
ncbi:peptidylprolyl isomerase [Acidisphaera sp. L21]|uniref:peptidylprolyl isomerase n=1 Tax=Acidisphaera sp. L21 TaxID=1641851 RepID=UPI00131B16DF|nr:peptidylprolyl isomerase [Acidisphaera sp. L21]